MPPLAVVIHSGLEDLPLRLGFDAPGPPTRMMGWVLLLPVRIGVPICWTLAGSQERRVALTPDVTRQLVGQGHAVVVESGAGLAAGHTDNAYAEAGATLGTAHQANSGDVTATIGVVDPRLIESRAIVGLLRPFDDRSTLEALAATGADLFAFEAMPRTTRAQAMDALSSQATAAGYQAMLEAATRSPRFFPMLTTAAGTIRPSSVLVLGAGVAGLQAIATARRLGAVVSAFDVRSAAAEQVQSLGGRFVDIDVDPQDEATSGGYAQELSADQQLRTLAALAVHVAEADVVVATAAIPGRPAPLLVTKQAVERMKPGSVIVDLAAATGGNCELTVAEETVEHAGVTIVGDTDIVGGVATHASQMYARNVAAFVQLLADTGGDYAPHWEDEIVREACVARNGSLAHRRFDEGDH